MKRTREKMVLGVGMAVAFLWGACGRSADHHNEPTMHIPEAAIEQLNVAIRHAPEYQLRKARQFDSIKNLLPEARGNRRWELQMALAEGYRQVNSDSAIDYAQKAISEAILTRKEPERLLSQMALSNALSTAGLFMPAMAILDSVRPLVADPIEKISYWKSSRLLESYMMTYMQDYGKYADLHRRQYVNCDDSLLAILPATDPFREFILCERLVSLGNVKEGEARLIKLLSTLNPEMNLYGMASFQLAEVYKHKGDFKRYAEYLAFAAESDIKSGVREGIALPSLAKWLYDHGYFDLAFNYINFALGDATSGNLRMRTVLIASVMPVIDQAYQKKIDETHGKMELLLRIGSGLLLVTVILLAGLLWVVRKMRANERKVAESSRTLEAYVGNFIGLCSNYAGRLEQLTKLVKRKLASGQSEELLKSLTSGRLYEEDNEEFYRLIDKALLDIFPDFVRDVNTLLVYDKQIALRPGDPLPPELRIYAFVRLGVDQSSRIAQILNYSVNTVYAYRNRMRNRAIDRENFDRDVANLGQQTGFSFGLGPAET